MPATPAIRARLPMPADAGCTPQQWRVLCDAIFPNAKTPEAITLALTYCKARNLDPFKRPVHIVPMWNKLLKKMVETVWPGINEIEVTASRTGQWAGMDEPKWGPIVRRTFAGTLDDRPARVDMTFPEWCAVTVYRMTHGQRFAYTEPVYWLETYATIGRSEIPNEMWQRRTRGQLHKCAKAASLRAAFPEELGNEYVADEMEGKDIEEGGVVIDGAYQETTAEPAGPAPDEAKPARRTWGQLLTEIQHKADAATTEEDVAALGESEDVQRVFGQASERTISELSAILVAAASRVRGHDNEQQRTDDEAGVDPVADSEDRGV